VRLHIGGFEKFPSFLLVALHFTKLTRRRLSEKQKQKPHLFIGLLE
jgi:hypothetical protein